MEKRTLLRSWPVLLVLASPGCGGGGAATPVGPSQLTPQAVVTPPVSGAGWMDGYTLTGVSLSGVVSESTPNGQVPIPGAVVYCERCGEITHTWATADDKGFYRFPGELATGGGVWLATGQLTQIIVRGVNFDQQTWVGQTLGVQIVGDTRFDVELVRR